MFCFYYVIHTHNMHSMCALYTRYYVLCISQKMCAVTVLQCLLIKMYAFIMYLKERLNSGPVNRFFLRLTKILCITKLYNFGIMNFLVVSIL